MDWARLLFEKFMNFDVCPTKNPIWRAFRRSKQEAVIFRPFNIWKWSVFPYSKTLINCCIRLLLNWSSTENMNCVEYKRNEAVSCLLTTGNEVVHRRGECLQNTYFFMLAVCLQLFLYYWEKVQTLFRVIQK